jgi:putative glycosyltransferase (TIGR04372 family)
MTYQRIKRAVAERLTKGIYHVGAIIALPGVAIIRLLRPIIRIRFGFFFADRIGHFAFDLEYCLSENALESQRSVRGGDFFFFEGIPANQQLAKLCKKELWVNPMVRTLFIANNWLPGGSEDVLLPARLRNESRDKVGLLRKTPAQLKIGEDDNHHALREMEQFGFESEDKFVCLIARDSAYLQGHLPDRDWSYHNFRDCDVSTYLDAAEQLSDRGYWVFRMGKDVHQPLERTIPRVVDYANSPFRSDLLDIWLMANCHFAISSGTGLDSVGDIFRRPILYANYDVFSLIVTWAKCITVPKRLIWQETGRELGIKEYFVHSYAHSQKYQDAGIDVMDMTSEEITVAVLEMVAWLDGNQRVSDQAAKRQDQFWREYSSQPYFQRYHGCLNPEARIGEDYLKRNIGQLLRS